MSDEEKKAIDSLKVISEYAGDNYLAKEHRRKLKLLIELVEKQSKEIEELKTISEYREKIIKGLGLKTLPKTITGFRELIENNDKKWEDKIKAKIEEIEKRRLQDGECELALHGFQREAKIEVLQSLLEKE